MHFLPDVYVTCDVCKGMQFNKETLEIKYKGKNIAQVLDMTVNQALEFFDNISSIRHTLVTLAETGLGYIKLGQAATTLSGGEAQRIKIARELSKKARGKPFTFWMNPPQVCIPMISKSCWLYWTSSWMPETPWWSLNTTLTSLNARIMSLILARKAEDQGGRIIAQGTPEQVAGSSLSHTGFYLNRVLSD